MNICSSVNTTEEAKELSEESEKVLKNGGFKVKGWVWNKELKDCENKEIAREKTVGFQEQIAEKVVRKAWNNKTDEMHFVVKSDLLDVIANEGSGIVGKMLTKRILLR